MSWLSRKFWPKDAMGLRDFSELTSYLIWAIIIAALCYDFYVIRNGKLGSSISAVMLSQSQRHPILAFSLGVVCGHLFWTNCAHGQSMKLPLEP